MTNYSIDDLYNKGYINGEVYYLCDENGISCLEDAVQYFSGINLPYYLESLRKVYQELNQDNVPELQAIDYWPGWKEDCIKIAKSHFRFVDETIRQFNSFIIFITYVQSQDWLFGQYYYEGSFKGEIDEYWKSRRPVTVDEFTAPWRIACKQFLSTYTSFVRNTIASIIDLYPNKESFIADLQSPSYAEEITKIKSFGKSRKSLIDNLIPKLLDCLKSEAATPEEVLSAWDVVSKDELWLQNFHKTSLKPYSVRTNNVLDTARHEHGAYASFYEWVLSPEFVPQSLRNAGKKTVQEINEWRQHVIESFSSKVRATEGTSTTPNNCLESEETTAKEDEFNMCDVVCQDESWSHDFYTDSLKIYTVRTKNVLEAVRDEHGAYSSFFKWVISPGFDPRNLRNAGKKTAMEIDEWRHYVIESIESKFKEMKGCAITPNDAYTPVHQMPGGKDIFIDFFIYLDSLNGARKELAHYIVESPTINGFTEIAENMSVTRERVRQLIPSIISDLSAFLSRKLKHRDYTKEEYFDIANNCGHQINNAFKMWAGSLLSSEIAIVGSLEKYISKGEPIIVVDGKLAQIFNFSQFKSRIDSIEDNKYYEETRIKIEDIILDCYIGDVQFEYLHAINRECRAILYDYYSYHLSEKEIIVPANAYYSIRQRVEDILEKEGSPLTIESIRKRLSDSGAPYDGSDNQLVSMIRKSTRIISYGYPTKFGLTTWGEPEEDAYGTIRDVAIHILLEHTPHILPEDDLVSALLAIYSESNERSILSNLKADSKQRFGFYQKENTMFIGLTNENYDSSYVLKSKGETKKTVSYENKKVSWQGTFDSVKRVLSSHNWTALDDQQRKWLINNWKKVQQGSLQEWQATQITELIENSKKR